MHKTTVHRVGPDRGLPSSGGWYGFSHLSEDELGRVVQLGPALWNSPHDGLLSDPKRETGQCNAEGVLVVDVFEYTMLWSVGAVRRRRRLPLYSVLLKSRRRRRRSA